MTELQRVPFAAGSGHLDRASHLREMADDLIRHRRAALLPVYHDTLLIDLEEDTPRLGWVPPLAEYIDEATEEPLFLGMSGETPCFAADFSAMEEGAATETFCSGAQFLELRTMAAELGPASASIAATAKGLIGWHLGHPFCARCGSRTVIASGGWRRDCLVCEAQHFPRTDPVVIVMILHDDAVLLGRQENWQQGLYSLLAGFMEPGETIEDAVRRETLSGTGVEVGLVSYAGCQPWPYPSNLMIACIGEAETTEIDINPVELEDAQWISRAKMQVILDGKHPRFTPPGKDAIARAVLADWCDGRLRLP